MIEIAPVDRDGDISTLLRLIHAIDAELYPDDSPIGIDELRRLRLDPGDAHIGHRYFAATDAGVAIGFVETEVLFLEDNQDLFEIDLCVHPDHRRKGVGSRLLLRALEDAEAHDRTSLIGWAPDSPEGNGFWTAVGATRRYEERVSRMDVTETDPSLMREWIDRARDRASAYRLEFFGDTCPDGLLSEFVKIREAMNDAPLDNVEIDDYHYDESFVRASEATKRAMGLDTWNLVAIENASGVIAGYTEVVIRTFRPEFSWQGNTVVLDAHRNRGIGRWLKAAMWQRVRAERPDIRVLETENAESNDPMLAINVAMGFRPIFSFAAFQAPTTVLAAQLTGN